ncbi:glycoside hydrolase family 15 protein [Streptomyces globisporus]|uniref:Glucoamylase (EC) n=1 Tax=Streptomyces globisporus TaxID=1908 RepID=A0ABN8VJN1_STRGL|nr:MULTISPECIES: glycoside hydrolase family 15 protein [Streptomyces]MYX05026.1 glycoside hydrolase family 15 protein [Streptomyces sp. SID8378]RDL04521.1 GH15 family glucan-1,4-alpha-glucosidase [Streptomyces sp. HB202]WSF80505.1 glycoside hydrolase family 15 protein [Streptomyces globisporus]CAH9419871.1 Glucoamylase (EC [Streptomyces globisporus]SNB90706.1 Glucoamylase (glucan-1,4-alpha-glucosidase), GH15 family [Streptomyces sp. PgraA7]
MSKPIENYALIGDLESAAMIAQDGAIDWLCLPRFDSPACFASLIGTDDNGFWRVAPVGAEQCSRRAYRDGTLILDTWWETDSGTVRVSDFMPPRTRFPCVVRTVEGQSGCVRVRSELRPRFNHGRVVPWVRSAGACTVAVAGPDSLWQRADDAGQGVRRSGSTVVDFTVTAGRRLTLMLAWAPSHLCEMPAPLCVPPETALKETRDFWQEWAAQCRYQGPWRDSVVRSLITLKALTYAPTGGIVAAPTASLPEHLGGERNWDYRYCWLRDSTLTLSCLLRSGYRNEAAAWLDWLLRAVAGGPAGLQTVYGIEGQRSLPETEAPWLPGYEGARPVRFGNAAAGQFQLDVYGAVLDTLYRSLRAGIPLQEHMWSLVNALMSHLREHWREPDQGLWEVRGPRRHFVHSKVMSWVAADRALRIGALLGRTESSGPWRALRDAVHAEVCRMGWDPVRRSFVQSYGSSALDASSLLMPKLGFLRPCDFRVRSTIAAMRELDQAGFVRRYQEGGGGVHGVDGLRGGEGTFVACSLWYADALAAMGERGRAREAFERVLAVRNDVGLLSEQWDPVRHRHMGNTPQAFSHIALVESAFALQRAGVTPEACA